MILSKILFSTFIGLAGLLFTQCAASTSQTLPVFPATPSKTPVNTTTKLPAQMPDDLQIIYKRAGGFAYSSKTITISDDKLTVEEVSGQNKTQIWTAKITKADKEKLYQIFVENKVDSMHPDGPQAVPADGVEYRLTLNFGGNTIIASTYDGAEEKGDLRKRFETVFSSINNLVSSYEGRAGDPKDKLAVLLYDSAIHNWIFKNAKFSTLSKGEISEIQDFVKKAIDEYNEKQSNPERINLESYKFQYLPVISESGDKEVWANSFCQTIGENWKNEVMVVDDGGKCFFNLKINLTTKQYYDLMVNGQA